MRSKTGKAKEELECWILKRRFSAIFFAHPIAQVFRSLKLQGLLVRIPAEAQLLCYFNFPIFKNSIKQLLQHDEINIVKDF